MGAKKGKNCKVTLGTDKVLGIGTYTLPGITPDELEATQFGDDYKTFLYGLKDGGQITFNGYYDPDDSTGQDVLQSALENDTNITDIRFYIDATSYWIPTTTNPASHVNVIGRDVSADKSGLMQSNFTVRLSGKMELI